MTDIRTNVIQASLWLALAMMPTQPANAAVGPNIVVILADDLGMHDVSCYGSEIPTPNIDSLAKTGARFNSFYVAAPVCTPSRFGLLTGRYPNRSQDRLIGPLMFQDPRDDRRGIRPHETTIAEVLRTNGYATALIGKWHLGHGQPEFLPNRHGFDYTYGCSGGCVDYFTLKYGQKADWQRNGQAVNETGYATDLITDDAVRYIEKSSGSPFFLYLAYTAPHYGKGWDGEKKQSQNVLQSKPADREKFKAIKDADRREYAGMIAAMDEGIGCVLTTLRQRGLETNTLVIFTSDNGGDPHYGGSNDPFRGRKSELFEGGIREPCLMVWPGRIQAGSVIDEPATALDFFPTFCELAGAQAESSGLDGNSLVCLLLQKQPLPPRDLFWQSSKEVALRRGDWKFVRRASKEMLFNLRQDSAETKDVAAAHPELLGALKAAHTKIAATFPKN